MIINVAFTLGLAVSFGNFLHNISIWISSYLNQVNIEKVKICLGYTLYQKNINNINISLGCIPTGSYIKPENKLYQDIIEIKDFELNEKSILQRIFILSSGIIVGILLLFSSSSIPIYDILSTYLSITFFQTDLESGNSIWSQLYTNPMFLIGFVLISMAITSFTITLPDFVPKKHKTMMHIFLFFVNIALHSVIYRLVWVNFEVVHIFYFLVGGLLSGAASTLLYIILAKLLPNKYNNLHQN